MSGIASRRFVGRFPANPLADGVQRVFGLGWLAVAYFGAHAALFGYDLATAASGFLLGDRGPTRMAKIAALLSGDGQFRAHLAANADPGDYVYHAALYALGGRYGVILVQILLGWLVVLATYRLTRRLAGPEHPGVATLAGALMIAMPGALWQPHTLVTETLYNPLLAIASLAMVGFLCDRQRRGALYAALVLIGVAISVRVQLALLPVLLVGYFWWHKPLRQARFILPIVPLSFAVPLGWLVVLMLAAGGARIPASDHGLTTNLHDRAIRIARAGQFTLAPEDAGQTTLSLGRFTHYVAAHPLAFGQTLASDAVNLASNSGALVIATNYLHLTGQAAVGSHWTAVRDRQGLLALARDILRTSLPAVLFIGVVEAFWVLGLLAAAYGIRPLLLVRDQAWLARGFLVLVLVYSLAVPFAGGAVRWQHRTPVEFILVMLMAAGVRRWQTRAHDKLVWARPW